MKATGGGGGRGGGGEGLQKEVLIRCIETQVHRVLQGKVLITEWVLSHKDTADHLW